MNEGNESGKDGGLVCTGMVRCLGGGWKGRVLSSPTGISQGGQGHDRMGRTREAFGLTRVVEWLIFATCAN